MIALAFNLFMLICFALTDVTKANILTVLWVNLFVISIDYMMITTEKK